MPKPLAFEVDSVTGNSLNYFLPIMKIDKDKRTVAGYASTETEDSDGEVIKLDAVKAALPDYMKWGNIREMHGLTAVGTAEEANIDRKGLWLTAEISDDQAWKKVLKKTYKGFSIGGRKLAKVGNAITKIAMNEISLVDRPSNPDCRFSIAKREKDSDSFAFVDGFELQKNKNKEKLTKAQKLANTFSQVSEFLLKADGKPPFDSVDSNPLDDANTPNKCEKHGIENCKVCAVKAAKKAAKIEKRKFSAEQRRQEAASGNAMSDGSFPIKNQKDLDNAVGLVGNSKHPKSEVKAHIRAMAQKHGLKLPEKWAKKTKKIAKTLKNESLQDDEGGLSSSQIRALFGLSAMPSFLTLGADGGGFSEPLKKGLGEARHDVLPNGLELETKPRKDGTKLKKSKSKLDDLDLVEFLGEDFAMAQQNRNLNKTNSAVPTINSALAELLKRASQPSRAQRMEMCKGNLKKANRARKEARDSVEEAHKICKAAYLSKMQKAAKSKKPNAQDDGDADDMDMEKVMSALSKAYSDLGKVGTFMKAAKGQLAKVSRSGQRGQEAADPESGFYEVPAGVKDLTPAALAMAGPGSKSSGSMPPEQMLDENWANKLAKAVGNQPVTPELVALIEENARLNAQVEFFGNQPGGGPRPFTMDMTKFANGTFGDRGAIAGNVQLSSGQRLAKAVKDSGVNPHAVMGNWSESGKVIGTYMLDRANGRTLFDPDFKGAAGGRS